MEKNLPFAKGPYSRAKNEVLRFFSLLLLLSGFQIASATTIPVTSLPELQTAINNAAPGDVIILANGVYTATTDITINKKGTAAQPITIAAQSIGGAEITGSGGFSIVSPAAYIIIKGFTFTHAANHAKMASGTSFCRWTRNTFETPGEGEYLLLNGNDHEVDYNTFQNKSNLGRFIAVRGSGSQIAQRLWIHHNYFYKQLPGGGNGAETLQFGLSGYSLSSSNSVIEHNVFEECDGENELISVKASALTIRYNTIRNCPAQFTLRHGNHSQVYGNYFSNTPGLRIFGDDHVIFSNYFENCSTALDIGNGDGEVADGAPLTSHDRPDRILIAFNTLVNCSSNFKQGGRTGGLGATFVTVANNIVQGGGAAASIAGPYTNPVWTGNILFNVSGPGAMPASGYTITDPLLARDITGTYHLQTGSPAINAITDSFPAVVADMDGQPRTAPFDIGADEVSQAPVTARLLNPADVGAHAAGDVPVASFTAPANKAIVDAGANIPLIVDALSFSGAISKIAFSVDGVTIGEDTMAPYSMNWIAVEGAHTITAIATDNNGKESLPAAVLVTVNPAGSHLNITSPVSGSGFTAPASIAINVAATDDSSTITTIEFFNGATSLGKDSVAPYAFTWTNVAAGNYTLQAKATNALNKTSLSVPVSITVHAAPVTSFDITDNGGAVTAQYPNTSKPAEDVPSLIDNNRSSKYFRSGRNVLWVQYRSTVPAIVVKYTLTSANDVPGRDPSDWNLQGSNNGTDWTTLDTRTGESFSSRLLTKTYTFNNATAYQYYRLNITNNSAALATTGTQFAEWELFERRTQTISFENIGDTTYGVEPIVLAATASSGLPVRFEVGSGPASIYDSLLTITGAGTITVRAIQEGNENYFPDTAEQTFMVSKAMQTISFDPVETKTFGDGAFDLSATSDAGLPVTFELVSGPVTINGTTVTINGAGTATIRAIQAGDENYEAAFSEQVITINKAAQTISFTAITPSKSTDSVQLTATASSGLPVSYSIVSGPGIIHNNTLSFTGEGNVVIRASEPGNENYLPADPVNQTVLVFAADEKKDCVKIRIYPNPTHGRLKVKLDNRQHDKQYTLIIYNSSGNPVQSTVIQKNQFQFEVEFNLTNYQNGIYYLYIFDGTTTYVRLIRKD
ncbi:MAG: chondroitinase-B domain-containing protein [Niastella sp.]|uniref:chondroitinase-B domain-containing protein n=1 Tax=Niastella sp. TaxID=1869183 RepID=UPI00389AB12D